MQSKQMCSNEATKNTTNDNTSLVEKINEFNFDHDEDQLFKGLTEYNAKSYFRKELSCHNTKKLI